MSSTWSTRYTLIKLKFLCYLLMLHTESLVKKKPYQLFFLRITVIFLLFSPLFYIALSIIGKNLYLVLFDTRNFFSPPKKRATNEICYRSTLLHFHLHENKQMFGKNVSHWSKKSWLTLWTSKHDSWITGIDC